MPGQSREAHAFFEVTVAGKKRQSLLDEGLRLERDQAGLIAVNGSRQTILAIESGEIRFESGLELDLEDGRVRQGDVVTTYKAQGASRGLSGSAGECGSYCHRIIHRREPMFPSIRCEI